MSNPLDPTYIKRYVIQTEARRAENSNGLPENRLFDGVNLQAGSRDVIIGQQDAKEFFMCLDENHSIWVDVFSLFNCSNVSRQQECYDISSFISLNCPQENTTLKSYIETKMNGFELKDNWRDESGCNIVTTGKNRRKITDMASVCYLVFVVKRLIKVDNQLLILDTKIKAEMHECIELEDSQGNTASFQLLCVVHHMGNVIGRDITLGHYCADVRNFIDGNWYRTSDTRYPVNLMEKGLSDNGYIFLLKRILNQTDPVLKNPGYEHEKFSTNDIRNLVFFTA